MGLWRWKEIAAGAGRDLGFRRTGLVSATERPGDLADGECWVVARGVGHRQEIVEVLLKREIGIAKHFSHIVIGSPIVKPDPPLTTPFEARRRPRCPDRGVPRSSPA